MISESRKTESALKFVFYGLIVLIIAVMIAGIKILGIPILLSILVYYAFHGLINDLESYGINRALAISIIFIVIGGIIYSLFYFYLPVAVERLSPFLSYWTKEFENQENGRFAEQIDWLLRVDSEFIQKTIPPGELAKNILTYANSTIDDIIDSVPNIITYLLITPIFSFFLLLDANSIYKACVAIVPNRFFEMTLMITHRINEQVTNYLKGLIIQSTIMAVIASVCFYFLGLKFFVVFGIFLGVANVIPYLGPVIGLIPPAIYALVTGGSLESVWPVASVVLLCQLIDNVLVQPTVIAKSASLHPLLVLIGITVGGNLLGLWGMLLAIPILSVLKVTLGILYKSLKEHGVI
ncbi:AI-2E family transporter [Leptospira sp. GIMC2001]|uniref:AI-2E family transporter n=1 Tax=Leptospira sp. GIMC2001 TaxID=1513297 RepID=UPI0023491667|nr:AI-2E family transporter [Leptospira sp. GIMC2001]WCL50370.1 AI-2E family transporter [Leptospira sp. GIMC2001]